MLGHKVGTTIYGCISWRGDDPKGPSIMFIFVLSDRKIFQNYEAIYNLPIYAFEKFKI